MWWVCQRGPGLGDDAYQVSCLSLVMPGGGGAHLKRMEPKSRIRYGRFDLIFLGAGFLPKELERWEGKKEEKRDSSGRGRAPTQHYK